MYGDGNTLQYLARSIVERDIYFLKYPEGELSTVVIKVLQHVIEHIRKARQVPCYK